MNTTTTVGVLGLARSGRAAAELALSRGASVYASDASDSPALRATAQELRACGADVDVGRHDEAHLALCDVVVVSPGIPPTAPILASPALGRIERVSEIEFAFRFLRSPVIAVTGTNGKTTTAALIAHLLTAAGFDAPAAGNIGEPLSALALRDVPPDWAVVEASSFQLADIRQFAPRIGVVTNLSPDHLDRYATVEAYYADKARLFENATEGSVWVLNGEDADVLRLADHAPGWRQLFVVEQPLPREAFGGFICAQGRLVLHLASGDVDLIGASELPLLGLHNRANALAAALTAVAGGADSESVRRGLRTFRPPPHRLEPVAERDGVLWINDSKATNIAAARVAIRSMERPTVLLLGGRHKGEPYTGLLPDLTQRVRVVLAYGEAAEAIERDLRAHVEVERLRGPFEDVMARAAERALPGDAVLLAPACSSYDMFRDYEERGRRFAELVRTDVEVPNGA